VAQSAPVVIVTGASRGAGRGIAKALGGHGCTVYVTGRSQQEGDASLPGTIHATAAEVTEAGGKGIAVACDSGDDAQVTALFDQVDREQGRIDILVNNAAAIHDQLAAPGHFWERPFEVGKLIDVGVRSGFVASWHAAHRMVKQNSGLIVFTSSPGAAHYCFGAAYGAHKAGMDKMAFDMAVDFNDAGVTVAAVSIWMGGLLTERVHKMMADTPEMFEHVKETMETPEFTGEAIWALYNDPALMELSGQTLIGAELGPKYGITDIGGKYPVSIRERAGVVPFEYFPYKVKQ
jgi:NAD(P)-dependent dehydrogenase (short-subunit alcohol dehydrogenase family)